MDPGTKATSLSDKETTSRKPKHGNPAAGLSPHESVLNVRVGSEAAVDSGTGPVLPGDSGELGAMTEVHNKDLKERDRREREKRGPEGGVHDISVSFTGLMAVEVDGQFQLRSGSFTGRFQESVVIRPLTEKEREEHLPKVEAQDRPRTGGMTSTSRGPR